MTEAPKHVTQWLDSLKMNRFHGTLIFLAALTLIFDGYDRDLIAYVMPQIMRAWHLNPVQLGSIASYNFIGLMIGHAGFGMMADRLGRKKSLMLALAIFTIFTGTCYFPSSFSTFCILRFLGGLGMGGAMPLTVALVSEYSPSRIRGKTVAGMFSGFTFGRVIAALVAIVVIPAFGWRMVLLVGALPALFIPVLGRYLPESSRFLASKNRFEDSLKEIRKVEKAAGVGPFAWTQESLAPPSVEGRASIKDLFRGKLLLMTVLVSLTYFLNLLINTALVTWLPTLLIHAGYSVNKSYTFGLLQAVGASAGGLVMGWGMDRFGRKATFVTSYIVGGIAVISFGMITNGLVLYIVGVACGVFILGAQVGLQVVAGEIYPTHIRSTGIGWVTTIGRLGSITGPLLAGALQMMGFTFKQYFIVFGAPCFICALLVMFYRVNVKDEGLETITAKLTTR